MRTCKKCGSDKSIEQFGRVRKDYRSHTCKECKRQVAYPRQQERIRRHKKEAVRLMGGKCSRCSAILPAYCYDFHHPDEDKEMDPVVALQTLKFEEAMKEIRKCELVCVLCHRHIQYGQGGP